MLDPLDPDLVPLSEIGKKFASPAVLCRWHLKGSNGTKLDTLKIAGRVYTTRDEFRRFLRESQLRHGQPAAAPIAPEREQEMNRQLNAAGLI
jgi:hypothetical protein